MKTKTCGKCKNELDISNFHKQSSNKTGYQHYCKVCVTNQTKLRYKNIKDHIVSKNMINNILIRNRNFEFVKRYLQIFGKCVDCGINDIRVLEFDHVRDKKIKGVKDMCGKTASIKTIKKEIKKCEIRCCNCHRIKTAIQLGWKRM